MNHLRAKYQLLLPIFFCKLFVIMALMTFLLALYPSGSWDGWAKVPIQLKLVDAEGKPLTGAVVCPGYTCQQLLTDPPLRALN